MHLKSDLQPLSAPAVVVGQHPLLGGEEGGVLLLGPVHHEAVVAVGQSARGSVVAALGVLR